MSSRLYDLIHDRNFILQLIEATIVDNPEAIWDQDDQDELDLQDDPPKFTRGGAVIRERITHPNYLFSKGEYGSFNDKTICKMDPFVADIMHGRIYKDVESTIYYNEGQSNDGGKGGLKV